MQEQLDMLFNPVGIGIVIFTVCAILTGVILHYKGKKTKLPVTDVKAVEVDKTTKPNVTKPNVKLGTGKFKCYVLRQSGVLEHSVIPEPIGNIFTSDVGMPIKGACYLVKENPDGNIVDYDPRSVEFNDEETPIYAYHALHWNICDNIFKFGHQWWQSVPTWLAVGSMALAFLIALIYGG